MSNRFRTEIQEEEAEQELIVEEKPSKGLPDNFLTQFLKNGVVTSEDVTRALPFVFYIAFLCMVYIGLRHVSDNNIRDIDKVGKQVKELSWEYKSSKAELAFKSTLTEVAKRAEEDSLGIRSPEQPPQKIVVKEGEQK
ncbi:FtsL-like putative cell division protein [Mucilaginibacter sp.]|uniref:FtsL-like putative cell division protein n=1 Tax=Mucilaginibacter sp. TaxID=1882438 RepID=UPI0032664309